MIANAIFVTTILFLALAIFLLQECQFLIPYRHALIHYYGGALLFWGAVLFLNLFAAVYSVVRWLFLKDTGRKLAHLDKQLRSDPGLSDELLRKLRE
jgi:hypothetical protein